MKNRMFRFAFLGLALLFAAAVQADAQTVTGTTTQTKYTKEYISFLDYATIDVVSGSANYTVFIRKGPDAPWIQMESQTGLQNNPDSAVPYEAIVAHPDSYQLRIVVSSQCLTCVNVTFRQ